MTDETIKNRQRQAWSQGDYMQIATDLVLVSELLCESVDLRAGQRVLDVATGTGNTAISAARRRCDVVGVDYVPTLLALGHARAAAEHLPVTFQEGDAELLPFPEAAFDVVLSTFGVMFAPDQEQAARELLRVCRPGGKIGLASWTPDSFPGSFRRVIARYVTPPPGLPSPLRWGTESEVRELFGEGITALSATPRSVTQRYVSARHSVEHLRTHFGPVVATFAALDPEHQKQLTEDLVQDAERFNRSGDATFVVPLDYLEVVAVRR
jgi:ubiquinone/menaquinone biosynthesis C-methylase UbiE